MNEIVLDPNTFIDPVAEGNRVAKLLWKHTSRLPRHRTESERIAKTLMTMSIQMYESPPVELEPSQLARFGQMLVFWKAVLENYRE